jgi:hypothetical protein
MIRQRLWRLAGALLLVGGVQFYCGVQLYAQQADVRAAAAAKAAAGQEARARAAPSVPHQNPPGPGTFTTFDAPGAGTGRVQGTFPASINPAVRPAVYGRSLRALRPRRPSPGRSTMALTLITASCVPATARLPSSMRRALARVLAKAPYPWESPRRAKSWGSTETEIMSLTASS